MKRLFFILSIVFSCLCSCIDEGIDYPPSVADQTVFMYLPWSGNLTSYFRTNISDLKSAIVKKEMKNERVVVFFHNSPTEASLFELRYCSGGCVVDTIKYYDNPAFTTARGITSILNDVKNYAPAGRYGMVIGCHGMGWVPVDNSRAKARARGEKEYWEHEDVLMTRWFGGTSAEYQTDITTLAKGIFDAGIKMEYILFDDCYMSSIEVAYDLKDVTDHLIGSTSEVMAYGMPYADMGQYLIGKVDYEGASNAFFNFYQNYIQMPCGTIGVTVCSEVEKLASIMKRINEQHTFNSSLLYSVQRLDGYTPVRFFDYGDYVAKLCTDEELLSEFQEQLERTVPSKSSLHTEYYYSMSMGRVKINSYSGITTSDPSTSSYVSAKTETAWYKATH